MRGFYLLALTFAFLFHPASLSEALPLVGEQVFVVHKDNTLPQKYKIIEVKWTPRTTPPPLDISLWYKWVQICRDRNAWEEQLIWIVFEIVGLTLDEVVRGWKLWLCGAYLLLLGLSVVGFIRAYLFSRSHRMRRMLEFAPGRSRHLSAFWMREILYEQSLALLPHRPSSTPSAFRRLLWELSPISHLTPPSVPPLDPDGPAPHTGPPVDRGLPAFVELLLEAESEEDFNMLLALGMYMGRQG